MLSRGTIVALHQFKSRTINSLCFLFLFLVEVCEFVFMTFSQCFCFYKGCRKNRGEKDCQNIMAYPYDLNDYSGTVERYFSEDGGLLECKVNNEKKSIIFFRDCIFVNGILAYHVVNLSEFFRVGTSVKFCAKKICLDIGEKSELTVKVYQASIVWVGYKPRIDKSMPIKKVNYLQELSSKMNLANCLNDKMLCRISDQTPVYLTTLHVSSYEDKRDVLNIGERFVSDLSGKVLGYVSDAEGILLCEIASIPHGVLFQRENVYLNDRRFSAEKSVMSRMKIGTEWHCDAIKMGEVHPSGVGYYAPCVWNVARPSTSLLFDRYLKSPAEPLVKLCTDTIYEGVVVKISPPDMALVAVEGKNKVIPVVLFSKNIWSQDDGRPLVQDGLIEDYIQEYSYLTLKIELLQGKLSLNNLQVVSRAWKSSSPKAIDKLGCCMQSYLLQVGYGSHVSKPLTKDSKCKVKKFSKSRKDGLITVRKTKQTEVHIEVQDGKYSFSADFTSVPPNESNSACGISKKNTSNVTKCANKGKNGTAKSGTSVSPPNTASDVEFVGVEKLEGISGKILHIAENAGIIECVVHKKNFKVAFGKNVVIVPSSSKITSLRDLLPIGRSVQFDARKCDINTSCASSTFLVKSVWVGKRSKKLTVDPPCVTLAPKKTYRGKVTECREPFGFITEIENEEIKYSVFVFNFVFRVNSEGRVLGKSDSIAPYIHVNDEVFLIVRKNENLGGGFMWEATEAWKVHENNQPKEIWKQLRGTIVHIKKDNGSLEGEGGRMVPFSRNSAYLLGIPLKSFNLQHVLRIGEVMNYKYLRNSDEVKVWFGEDNVDLEDDEHLVNVFNYCITRDVSLPAIQKLTDELENQQRLISIEKIELVLASQDAIEGKDISATLARFVERDVDSPTSTSSLNEVYQSDEDEYFMLDSESGKSDVSASKYEDIDQINDFTGISSDSGVCIDTGVQTDYENNGGQNNFATDETLRGNKSIVKSFRRSSSGEDKNVASKDLENRTETEQVLDNESASRDLGNGGDVSKDKALPKSEILECSAATSVENWAKADIDSKGTTSEYERVECSSNTRVQNVSPIGVKTNSEVKKIGDEVSLPNIEPIINNNKVPKVEPSKVELNKNSSEEGLQMKIVDKVETNSSANYVNGCSSKAVEDRANTLEINSGVDSVSQSLCDSGSRESDNTLHLPEAVKRDSSSESFHTATDSLCSDKRSGDSDSFKTDEDSDTLCINEDLSESENQTERAVILDGPGSSDPSSEDLAHSQGDVLIDFNTLLNSNNSVLDKEIRKAVETEISAKFKGVDIDQIMNNLNSKIKMVLTGFLDNAVNSEIMLKNESDSSSPDRETVGQTLQKKYDSPLSNATEEQKQTSDCAAQTVSTGDIFFSKFFH